MKPDNHVILHTSILLFGLALCIVSKTVSSADNTPQLAQPPAQQTPVSKVLAEVNGRQITEDTLQRYIKFRGLPKDADPQEQRTRMIEELINRELLYIDAVEKGVDKLPEVKADLENQQTNVIAGAMLKQATDSVTLTDEQLKQAYQDYLKSMPAAEEFKARHILLEEETQAKAVIEELNKGADFAKLAQQKSTGPSGPSGGDLGWFQPSQMVEPFAQAVMKLKNGEYSKAPVHTQFGWHVVLREDSRQLQPPSFDSLKEQFRMRLLNKNVEHYIGSLRDKAEITRY
ncbi:MAG: peptidylprolyl isomerase [Gammaproteobacteria bacterium]|jgi:peptidyl-prolyl cis-trans isomerase C|nr:peptidylprolyl isomerase [Gammaproteobacteria bacterium]